MKRCFFFCLLYTDINDEYSGKISRKTNIFVVLINGNDKSHIRHSDEE